MNIKSMTGFGVARSNQRMEDAADLSVNGSQPNKRRSFEVEVEIRSVNSRFLEVNVKVPQGWGAIEQELQGLVKKSLKRGRVDVNVRRIAGADESVKQASDRNSELNNVVNYNGVYYNRSLFLKFVDIYQQAIADAEELLGAAVSPNVVQQVACELLRKREVLDIAQEGDVELPSGIVIEVAKVALAGLVEMRSSEGRVLEDQLVSLLSELKGWKDKVAVHATQVTERVRERLMERLSKLEISAKSELPGATLAGLVSGGNSVSSSGTFSSDDRLLQEVVLVAERADISEELVRLDSHITQFVQFLHEGTGKKLEFLLQEMGREINTIGSKGQLREVSQAVVESKSVLEKMREQLANCE